jgi:glycosyltransferase involved in cell wall biosynthesis
VLCREEKVDRIDFANTAHRWDVEGKREVLYEGRAVEQSGQCTIHVLPHGEIRPVFVTDKQRAGNVKAFKDMSDAEVEAYRAMNVRVVTEVLRAHPVDVLHANHVVMQPTIAADACGALGIPFIIYPHGSAIEYTVRPDERFQRMLRETIERAAGLIIGSNEVRNRILELYPDRHQAIMDKSDIIGVGVDTSLFEPIAKAQRTNAIAKLKALKPAGGKPMAQEAELRKRLDAGELEAVLAYTNAYPHAHPDAEVVQKVDRVPWLDGNLLLFVGALTVGKGLQSVIAGLPRVLKTVPKAHLVIVGSGRYREVLEALVHAIATSNRDLLLQLTERGNDLDKTHLKGQWGDVAAYLADPENLELTLGAGADFADHVHFLGRLNHDLLRFVFPCVDVALFPSVIPEAYPLVLMESLSNGVLPTASNFSGFREGLDQLVPDLGEERVDLMRLPMEDATRVKGIADRLAALLSDERDWTQDLRDIATSRYDWAIRAEQMATAYRRYAGL